MVAGTSSNKSQLARISEKKIISPSPSAFPVFPVNKTPISTVERRYRSSFLNFVVKEFYAGSPMAIGKGERVTIRTRATPAILSHVIRVCELFVVERRVV